MLARQQKLKGDYIGVKNYLRTRFVAVFYPAPGVTITDLMSATGVRTLSWRALEFRSHTFHDKMEMLSIDVYDVRQTVIKVSWPGPWPGGLLDQLVFLLLGIVRPGQLLVKL